MNTLYELYGGPLDGLTATASRKLKENDEVSFDLVSYERIDGTGSTLTKPAGVAVFTMKDGRLTFTAHKQS